MKGKSIMNTNKNLLRAIACLTLLGSSAMFFTGCTKKEKTVAGVLIGAGLGAGIGAAAGGGVGAAIGGVGGAAVGGVVGNSLGDDKKDK